MFKRNSGKFIHKITLKKPSADVRDELGGLVPAQYTEVCSVFANVETRSQSRQQIMGDFITVDTRYFIVRELSKLASGLNTDWQLVYNGFTFKVNQVELITESRPYFVQITATALNSKGGII